MTHARIIIYDVWTSNKVIFLPNIICSTGLILCPPPLVGVLGFKLNDS